MNALQFGNLLDHKKGLRRAIVGALMAFPMLVVLVASRLGPGLTTDSIIYASAARSYADQGELIDYGGRSLSIFPPGLPMILGTAERIGIDLQTATVALNAICVALCVLLTYLLARATLESLRWSLTIAAFVALSSSTSIYAMLWSEPLFTALALAALLVLAKATQRAKITSLEILAIAVAVSAATSIRFVGFTLLPVVALGVFLAARTPGVARAIRTAIMATGLSAIGLLAVVIRNLSLGVSALGERSPSGISVGKVLKDTALTIGLYAYPAPLPSSLLPTLIGSALGALIAYAFAKALAVHSHTVVLLGTFSLIYWLALWYSQFATTIDYINHRLTVPAFTPTIILAAFGARELIARFQAGSQETAARVVTRGPALQIYRVLAGLLLLSLALNALASLWWATKGATTGIGLNKPAFRNSPLALSVVDLPGGIASNNPPLVYWSSGRHPIREMPRENHRWSPDTSATNSTENLRDAVASGEVAYLALFTGDTTALTPRQLEEAGIDLELLDSYADGDLYELRHP